MNQRYDIIISEVKMTREPAKIQEMFIDHVENATLHKLQLMIGRFMIEHSRADIVKCETNAMGLLFVITDYSQGTAENPKIIRMTVKEEA